MSDEKDDVSGSLGWAKKLLTVGVGTFFLTEDALKTLSELEKENARLKRAVADLTLDKAILKEIAEGKW